MMRYDMHGAGGGAKVLIYARASEHAPLGVKVQVEWQGRMQDCLFL